LVLGLGSQLSQLETGRVGLASVAILAKDAFIGSARSGIPHLLVTACEVKERNSSESPIVGELVCDSRVDPNCAR
jgi:hypothetical protein